MTPSKISPLIIPQRERTLMANATHDGETKPKI